MERLTRQEMVMLGLGAAAVTSLGTAMHLEHRDMRDACMAPLAAGAELELAAEPPPHMSTDPFVPDEPRAPAAPARPVEPLAYGPAFAFVVQLDQPYLVLSTEIEPTWREGELQVVAAGRVHAEVALDALPLSLSSWQDRSVVLYGANGAVGFGEVGVPQLIADIDGDLPLLLPDEHADAYYEALERGDEPPPLPADLVWESGRQLLVAPIETATEAPISWARDAELPTPRVLVPTREPANEARPAVEAAKRLLEHPEANALAERLEEGVHDGATARLDERVHLATWRDADGDIRAQSAWFEGPELGNCGLDAAPVWSGVELGRDGSVRPLPWMAGERVMGPIVIADLNLDGHLDVVQGPDFWAGDWTLYAGAPDGWTPVASLPETPYHGCPC